MWQTPLKQDLQGLAAIVGLHLLFSRPNGLQIALPAPSFQLIPHKQPR